MRECRCDIKGGYSKKLWRITKILLNIFVAFVVESDKYDRWLYLRLLGLGCNWYLAIFINIRFVIICPYASILC